MEIQRGDKPVSRKKFVVWTAGILSAVAALTFFTRSAPQKKTRMVKMLTRDGKLVEIEISKLPSKRNRIKDDDIHAWVQRKPSL
jgi:hypothetical protein